MKHTNTLGRRPGPPAARLLAAFDGLDLPGWLAVMLRDGLGGVTLFERNVASRDQLVELTEAIHQANPAAIVAIDEEGGAITRLGRIHGADHPTARELGADHDVEVTFDVAASIGRLLADLGMDLDLAPVADLDRHPSNPIVGARSFGADPQLVARHVTAWVRGLQSQRVMACAKHFPGHGASTIDSHLGLPVLTLEWATLRRTDLVPFIAAIDAGVAAIMPGHLVVPDIDPRPASMSAKLIQEKLRGELGFRGLVVSDALDMAALGGRSVADAAIDAIAAGADLVCLSGQATTEAEMVGIMRRVSTAPQGAE
jgi:beta-N-acetylhexosaminidase